MAKIHFIQYRRLKPHEQIRIAYVVKLTWQIWRDGQINIPIIVDRETLVILDGHHRFTAAKILRWPSIPVHFVDYHNKHITVGSWRNNVVVTKAQVLAAGLTGRLLKPKTSRHFVPMSAVM